MAERKHDYGLHGRQILWVIDCTACELTCGPQPALMIDAGWKFMSFAAHYDVIFCDLGPTRGVHRICPGHVGIADYEIDEYADEDAQVSCRGEILIDSDRVITMDDIRLARPHILQHDPLPQCFLHIRQQGAGNGKTYGIIQLLNDPDFAHYSHFVFLTKMHSAKFIMNSELTSQHAAEKLPRVQDAALGAEERRKFTHTYTNALTGRQVVAVFGTMDSFVYSHASASGADFGKGRFLQMCRAICNSTQHIATMEYGAASIPLTRGTCIICDEIQDLDEEYARAIVALMRRNHLDVYVVGDRLQSITMSNNAFVYLSEGDFGPDIRIVKHAPTNVCRRFTCPDLVRVVNTAIRFDDFGLPAVTPYAHRAGSEGKSAEAFFLRNATFTDRTEYVEQNLEKIMMLYRREVEERGRRPEDFLIITPLTKAGRDPLIPELEREINEYWLNRLAVDDRYQRFAVFHKSEEGSAINLAESVNATRMVSIHASKGDGRPVVFLVGVSEGVLRDCFCGGRGGSDLQYESLLHVALTRMKEQLYVALTGGVHDDLYTRLHSIVIPEDVELRLVPNRISVRAIAGALDNEDYGALNKIFNLDAEPQGTGTEGDREVIDYGHHTIRYLCLLSQFWLRLAASEDYGDQMRAIFGHFCKLTCAPLECDGPEYACIMRTYSSWWKKGVSPLDDPRCKHNHAHRWPIPLRRLRRAAIYDAYFDIIYRTIIAVQDKLRLAEAGSPRGRRARNYNLCPYELIVLQYCVGVLDHGYDTPVTYMDLYNVTDSYCRAFRAHDATATYACGCAAFAEARRTHGVQFPAADNRLSAYILAHYEIISHFDTQCTALLESMEGAKVRIESRVNYNGGEYSVRDRFTVIARTEDTARIIRIAPNYNALNADGILTQAAVSSFFLAHEGGQQTAVLYTIVTPTDTITLDLTGRSSQRLDWNAALSEHRDDVKDIIMRAAHRSYCASMEHACALYEKLLAGEDTATTAAAIVSQKLSMAAAMRKPHDKPAPIMRETAKYLAYIAGSPPTVAQLREYISTALQWDMDTMFAVMTAPADDGDKKT